MSIHGARSRTFATNILFPAISLAVIGWGLLHAWGINVNIGIRFHALAALPGLVLSGVALYRYRQHWPINATDCVGRQKLAWDYRAIALYLMLVGTGFSIALLISGGSLFLLAMATMGTIFVPWTRIAVCRDHFFFASALVGAGALLGLVMLGRSVHPLYYPMVASLLLSVACTLVVFVILIHGNRLDRMPPSGY